MVCALLLVTDFVFSRGTAIAASGAIAVLLLSIWFAVPLVRYKRD